MGECLFLGLTHVCVSFAGPLEANFYLGSQSKVIDLYRTIQS